MSYPKFAGKYSSAGFKPKDAPATVVVQSIARRETVFDRAPSRDVTEEKKADIAYTYNMEKQAFIDRFGQEAWDKRERQAREVVHTVVPLPKSNYVMITDMSTLLQLNKYAQEK